MSTSSSSTLFQSPPATHRPALGARCRLAGRLACPDERFAEWAAAVGVDYGRFPQWRSRT